VLFILVTLDTHSLYEAKENAHMHRVTPENMFFIRDWMF